MFLKVDFTAPSSLLFPTTTIGELHGEQLCLIMYNNNWRTPWWTTVSNYVVGHFLNMLSDNSLLERWNSVWFLPYWGVISCITVVFYHWSSPQLSGIFNKYIWELIYQICETSLSFGFKSVLCRLIFKFGGLLPMSPVSCTLQILTSLTPENLPIFARIHY